MPCIASFIVLAILGIFSASHRELAREAFGCVFRRVTLKPCDTGFQDKMKGLLVGRLLASSVPLARFVNRRFEIVSWIFMILTVVSLAWFLRGVYMWWTYGSCNGLNNSGFCIFDPTGESNKTSAGANCGTVQPIDANIRFSEFDLSRFPTRASDTAEHQVALVGCYSCHYTRESYPAIMSLISGSDVSYTFIHFPTKSETSYLSAYAYCAYKADPAKFWTWNDSLFAYPADKMTDRDFISKTLSDSGYDAAAIAACTETEEAKKAAEDWHEMGKAAAIYGTPTVFIDGKPFVGPKPARVYRRAIGEWW